MPVKRIRKVEMQAEKRLLTGLIISTQFCKEVIPLLDPKLLEAQFVKRVVTWVAEHYARYEKAPGKTIGDIYETKLRHELDDDEAELLGDFLEDLSEEFERSEQQLNVPYLRDETVKYLKERSLEVLSEGIRADLKQGNLVSAEERITEYRRVERPTTNAINPFNNAEAIYNAFEQDTTPLFTFPGALGRMLNRHLVRDGLIGVQAPEKRGKTFWLYEFGVQAAKARCNTAIFAVGDMSEAQSIRRFHMRLARKSYLKDECGDVVVPILDCEHNQNDTCDLKWRTCMCGLKDLDEEPIDDPLTLFREHDYPPKYMACSECTKRGRTSRDFRGTVWYEERHISTPLTWREGYKLGKRLLKRTQGRDFKLSTHPNKSINVTGIEDHLNIWEHFEGFIPDVVIIDYADILAPEAGAREYRHQQNETWQAMRALSQKRHCLVVVGTQASAESYDSTSQTLKHFSEDKRKYGHVTGMFALNQKPEEKRLGMMRVGWLLLREGDFGRDQEVTVLQSMGTGSPIIASYEGRY